MDDIRRMEEETQKELEEVTNSPLRHDSTGEYSVYVVWIECLQVLWKLRSSHIKSSFLFLNDEFCSEQPAGDDTSYLICLI